MPKVGHSKSPVTAAIPMACIDEHYATEFLEALIWGSSTACPRCGDTDVYQMASRTEGEIRNKDRRWRCRGCKRQYTVRTGTIMEDSRIPLRHWCYAFWKACSSKKGVSALQIRRETGLSYKSALFLMHRVRYAMQETPDGPLSGTVEADETYVGGKPRKRTPKKNRQPHEQFFKKGRSADFRKRKTAVVAVVERDGPVRATAPAKATVSGANVRQILREHVDPMARLITDESAIYEGIGRSFPGGHETVRHSTGEYVRGDVHTNTVESFFALVKRGLVGTFHHVSRKHLERYITEFVFRWNHRKMEDGARTVAAIRLGIGKRLMYARHIES